MLLTGTVDPLVYGNIETHPTAADPLDRLAQYESSIEKWLTLSNCQFVVFAENSNWPFNAEKFMRMAKKHGKVFEHVQGDIFREQTIRYGKSYGEIRLMNDALDRSRLLADAKAFYKCTGRLFIRNINSILNEQRKTDNRFIVNMYEPWVTSWFFKADKHFYNSFLRDAHTSAVDRRRDNDIEKVYYPRLLAHKEEVSSFLHYPDVDGLGGGSGMPYNVKRCRLLANTVRMRIGSRVFGLH